MAASLSRPDPTSPASVAEAGFSTARRGYNTDEVRAFLTSVAAELGRVKEHERQLEAELRAARAAGSGRTELDDETVTNLLGEETLRVLQTARESASQIKTRAEETASRALREAHEEANRIRQEAEVESARRRHDAQSDAEAELAVAKQQGREMVNEARAYRERVLADLERRTKLARQHIDELTQGRDRLMQVFERARLVAVDVTSDLQAAIGPDEYVNLTPTTGPVPLMVPASKLDQAAPVDETIEEPTLDEPTTLIGLADEPVVEAVDEAVAEEVVDETVDETIDETASEAVEESVDDSGDDVVEAATDAAPTNEAVADETAQAVTRDTNVVALFPNREAAPVVELNGNDTSPATGVDDLFARLRSEVPADEVAADSEPVEAVESTAFTRRDEALVPLIVTGARKVKRLLADEQNGVLDSLRRKQAVTSIDMLMPAVDDHVASYVAALSDELGAASAAGAAELGLRDTKTLRRSLEKAGALDAARGLVRSELVMPLRTRIERSIADGGGDNDDITKRVRAVYREFKTQHIDDQLDDVFRFAFGGGLSVSLEPGTSVVWTIDPGEPACADCEDNSLAGPVSAGESFPTGHTSAPAHAGCRCLALPAQL